MHKQIITWVLVKEIRVAIAEGAQRAAKDIKMKKAGNSVSG